MALKVVILAAGKGTRMRSSLPKVLQPLAGQPLLQHVVNTAQCLQAEQILTVVGHQSHLVEEAMAEQAIYFVAQTEQLGTGHAVQQAVPEIDDNDTVLILYGDVPLTAQSTLEDLLALVSEQHPLALLTINLDNPSGYGRIVRDQHLAVQAIVEQKDASTDQLAIKEVNTGILAAKGAHLKGWLAKLSNQNAQGEYYLTDIIAMCVADDYTVQTTQPAAEIEVLGVNDKAQLQALERQYQMQLANQLMTQGVTLIDASRLDIRGSVTVGQDVQIDANVIFEGDVILGDNVQVGANCILKSVTIAAGTVIHPFSHLEECVVGEKVSVGPYARLRPGTDLADEVRIGNFVETKKAKIGKGSKVNHLSYVGDTLMGSGCNVGAGTITCNYDGVNKHLTEIGDNVFVGSDTQLVAPVKVGDGATIGAGSTITKEVPAEMLTLSRSKQLTIKNWVKPVKK
ncbi:bifunctional UDP-N-acetylglucosamine diphosphorylase/glucosamine-1-phosphate N-acetyltransferase GlmU [Thiomicrorhabdus sp. 6S3-12]|uniref:bifunctional UDP-N-acetylglucosamine diphosphorylase/glucosamine-1-phosphate N-acetyltransferase GlmU n=1 Tax=Thiomicrorhabdus sp. 6S3-12 TaxID=2819681 RepID=UPI001AAD9CBE|nr:bifunctional UDP-N-acetylglucosamine diphosphorylase/glucosamine-1-phosphate N-acetyltransferase GlmU [Thiomicrorhabdus sp. 6S3-12]MBO1923444.1 bifunctional UDP-N-acetylglucosamine diphosphorylase/glucosamine-1-phosphate N-acetyltransferase GlmU [Thiomicrorhabdus sp. 6S3-12]